MRYLRQAASRAVVVFFLLAVSEVVWAQNEESLNSRLQAELEWVADELRTIRYHSDDAAREKLEEDVRHLEEEREKLLRVMPERIDVEERLETLRARASTRDVAVEPGEPVTFDHGEYQTITLPVRLVGSSDSIESFARSYRLSTGVKRFEELEVSTDASLYEVTFYMIPDRAPVLKRCSIPEVPSSASQHDSQLRQRLIAQCAALDAADPELRKAIAREADLRNWIKLTSSLQRENSEPVEIGPEDDELMREIEAMFEEE